MNIDQDDQDCGDDSSGWLTSYADMMTLIACFFILMIAFANFDPVGFSTKARKLSSAFKGQYKSSYVKLKRITEEVSKHPKLKKLFKISLVDTELVVTFSSSVLYEAGKSDLTESIQPFIDTLIEIIRAQAKTYMIMVEGHASGHEGRQEGISDLWALSSLRAAHVANRFEFFGYRPKQIVAIGKGESSPLFPEIDEKGGVVEDAARQNQTVLIRILEPKKELKKVKFGFGIFF